MLLIAVFTLALHPLHTLWLGLLIALNVSFAEHRAVSAGILGPNQVTGPAEFGALIVCILFATALSAISYRRIYGNYVAHRHELEAAQATQAAQSQLLLSENAASMGRLAATISHEVNTPLGALIRSAQLLSTLPAKRADAKPGEAPRLDQVEETRLSSILTSAERLKGVVQRMQRVTNLDRAEVTPIDLNMLVRDVIQMQQDRHKGVVFQLEDSDLPQFTARPQQISAVFSNLIHSAADRLGESGTVTVRTGHLPGRVRVTIHDDGSSLSPETTKALFEPGFQVSESRVVGSDWGLFSSREMIRRHGGDLEVESAAGEGTTIPVTLPIR